MTEEGGDTEEQLVRKYRNLLSKRRPLWSNFDKWIDEEPSVSRARFEIVRSALLVHCEYPAIVRNEVGGSENNGEYSLNQQFINFVNIANKTRFLGGTENFPSANVFVVLSELFSTIPEFADDIGIINEFLKDKLNMMLDIPTGWEQLFFNVNIVRSVYWQLLFTLQLAPVESEGQTESTMTYDENRAKLMFGSYIVAILVSIGYDHDTPLVFRIENFVDVDDVVEHLAMLISSKHFRTLSQFFLVGLSLLVSYKLDGNTVTTTYSRIYSAEKKEEDERKFQDRASRAIRYAKAETGSTPEEIQREWEIFVVTLLKRGFLKSPEGYEIVEKSGPPLKEGHPVSTRKRKIDDPRVPVDETLFPPQPPPKQAQQTSRSQKKDKVQRSPRKQRDLRKKQQISPQLLIQHDMPSTSAALAPKPRQVYPTVDDVGLVQPIYVRQADLLKSFREEVERRQRNGPSGGDAERVNQLVFESYDKMHLLNRLVTEAPPRSMKAEQAAVMQRIKKKWRRGNSEETIEDEDNIEDDEEEEEYEEEARIPVKVKKAKSGKKSSKKWKRQY